jgi:hypothetical protein
LEDMSDMILYVILLVVVQSYISDVVRATVESGGMTT